MRHAFVHVAVRHGPHASSCRSSRRPGAGTPSAHPPALSRRRARRHEGAATCSTPPRSRPTCRRRAPPPPPPAPPAPPAPPPPPPPPHAGVSRVPAAGLARRPVARPRPADRALRVPPRRASLPDWPHYRAIIPRPLLLAPADPVL